MKALHLLKQNVEEDSHTFYFESLTTENMDLDRNKQFLLLNDVDSTDKLFDSPFSQTNSRTKRNVLDFIILLECLINLKDGDKETLKKLFGDVSVIKMLMLIKKWIDYDNIEAFLNLLEVISEAIVIETENIEVNSKYINKYEDWQTFKIEKLSATLSESEKSQWIIIQLAFLFWCSRLNEMLIREAAWNLKSVNRALDDFFVTVNHFIPDEEVIIPSQIGLHNIIQSMFESSFFNDIAKRIFYRAIPETQAISWPESILGMIVGLALKNMNLVRTSLLNLLGKTKNRIMSGLFAILSNDPHQEKDIKTIWKTLKIKAELALNLVELMWNEDKSDKFNPLMRIWGEYSSSSDIICSIVSVVLGDLSWVIILSERFQVDHLKLSITLAAASRRRYLLRGNYKLLSKSLRINNEEAVMKILELICENEDMIYRLENGEAFCIPDRRLLNMVAYIDKNGRKMSKPHSRFDIPDWNYAWRVIADKLKNSFGIGDDIGTVKYEDGDSDGSDLGNIFRWIVDAAWGNSDAIKIILKNIQSKAKDPRNLINKIWTKYPRFASSVLTKSMKKIHKSAVNTMFERSSKMRDSIFGISIYLDALFKNKKIDLDISKEDKDDAEIMKALKENKKQIAYKVGWTVNVVGEYEFCQEYMECETCQQIISGSNIVKVCLPWAEFWHAGHTLRFPKTPEIKMMWHWGTNKYPNWPINDKGNPLKNISGFENIPTDKWSLIFEGYSEFLKIKQHFKINRRLLNEDNNVNQYSNLYPNMDDNKLIEEEKNTSFNFLQENEGGEETIEGLLNNETIINDDSNSNAFYDDAELKEKFEEELSNYSPEDFIIDLVISLKYDCSKIANACPDLFKNYFYTYDESMWKYVHLYEHIILLASGFWRPGLIKMISEYGYCNTVYPKDEYYYTNNYKSSVWIVSLMQGDFENYLKYWKPFLVSLGVKEGSGSTFLQKAARLLMLCYSYTHFTEVNEISGVRDEYERMMRELFPKKHKSIMRLHKLVTLSGERLISIFSSKNDTSVNAKASRDKLLYIKWFEGLLLKSLELDNRSVQWIEVLIKVWIGDVSGLDYICKVYDISSSKVNIYKAIWSNDPIVIFPLFEAIKEEIPLYICESIFNILNGSSEAVWNLILKNIKIDKIANNLITDTTQIKANLKKIISNLFKLTANECIDREILTETMK